jgi:hypothetical protein
MEPKTGPDPGLNTKRQLGGPHTNLERGTTPKFNPPPLRTLNENGDDFVDSDEEGTNQSDGREVGRGDDDNPPDQDGMGEPCEGKDIEAARKAHPMFEIFFDWMVSYRPGRNKIPSEAERARDGHSWDFAPDLYPGEIPPKRLRTVEAVKFENFRSMPRSMGISPEDRFRLSGENEPKPFLMNEPSSMGSKWRKAFNPEDHASTGPVARLVKNREKQELLRAYSDLPDPTRVKFDYWALVRLVARRLLRAGGSKTQLRPSRPLYELFKEAFFYNRVNKRTADQRAWFFAHVRQTLMRMKDRYTESDYRPWEDPEIDMGASTDEDEENEAYVVIPEDGGNDPTKEMTKSDFWKGRQSSRMPAGSTNPRAHSHLIPLSLIKP